MLFSEPVFLFAFLPAVLLMHAVLGGTLRNVGLLTFSLFFYAWGEGAYVFVMVGSILLNYAVGLGLGRSVKSSNAHRWLLRLGILGNLAVLGFFKYANFAADNFNIVLDRLDLPAIGLPPVHLPIGVSFFTFQAMSYVIDVARGHTIPQRNPLYVGLYISLFPQLIAGPIVRYVDIAAEITKRTVTSSDFVLGIRRFIVGLAKKMIVANAAAVLADTVFGMPPDQVTGSLAWFGTACYTLQIYFDFSGYSDMAIGLGHMLGFRFLENFNYPYISSSITEFWRRWHISLSSWFRDYLYIPLGGNRGSALFTYRNLMIVFLLCGLWHGASWNFLIWGAFHGAFLVVERLGLGGALARAPRVLAHGYTLIVVMIGWVFFRAETLGIAMTFLSRMSGLSTTHSSIYTVSDFIDPWTLMILVVGTIGSSPVARWTRDRLVALERGSGSIWLPMAHDAAVCTGLAFLFLASMTLIAANTYNPFIYFRF
jgi:alginate O-acetyltransferase complex protein AlgI